MALPGQKSKTMKRNILIYVVGLILLLGIALLAIPWGQRDDSDRPKLAMGASIYVGWMPWFLAAEDGTLDRHAKERGIDIRFVQGEYIETINQFVAGNLDAVVLTNVDALPFLAGSGVNSDVILIGSYSNGNDAIVARDEKGLPATPNLALVEFSVSHYLMDRYAEKHQLGEKAITPVNVSDSEIAAAFASTQSRIDGVVTWNPIVQQLTDNFRGSIVYDSSSIGREIADMLVVRRETLEHHPEFAQALLATWFEVTGRIAESDEETIERLGELSGADGEAYKKQLETTLLITEPDQAVEELNREEMRETMKKVKAFAQRHGLMRNAAPEPWISYPGDPDTAVVNFNDGSLRKSLETKDDGN